MYVCAYVCSCTTRCVVAVQCDEVKCIPVQLKAVHLLLEFWLRSYPLLLFIPSHSPMSDEFKPEDMSPWVLRICLDSKSVNVKKLKMLEIASKITEFFGNGVHVIYTDDNSQTGLVLRVRILVQDEDRLGETEETVSGSEDHELLRRMQKQLLENLHLRGVAGIRKVRKRECVSE